MKLSVFVPLYIFICSCSNSNIDNSTTSQECLYAPKDDQISEKGKIEEKDNGKNDNNNNVTQVEVEGTTERKLESPTVNNNNGQATRYIGPMQIYSRNKISINKKLQFFKSIGFLNGISIHAINMANGIGIGLCNIGCGVGVGTINMGCGLGIGIMNIGCVCSISLVDFISAFNISGLSVISGYTCAFLNKYSTKNICDNNLTDIIPVKNYTLQEYQNQTTEQLEPEPAQFYTKEIILLKDGYIYIDGVINGSTLSPYQKGYHSELNSCLLDSLVFPKVEKLSKIFDVERFFEIQTISSFGWFNNDSEWTFLYNNTMSASLAFDYNSQCIKIDPIDRAIMCLNHRYECDGLSCFVPQIIFTPISVYNCIKLHEIKILGQALYTTDTNTTDTNTTRY